MDARDARRLKDLRAALKRAKADDLLSTEELALKWGTSKARFVTVMKDMAGMPEPQRAPRDVGYRANTLVYPAGAALEAMIAYLCRHEAGAKAKAARTAALLGRGNRASPDVPLHSVTELATMNRMMSEIEERERAQGEYIPKADVAVTIGNVFSELSDFCSALAGKVDPHGELNASLRAAMDKQAKDLLLQLHRKLKHLLAPDAVADRNRDSSPGARQSRARRKRG